MRSTAKLFYVDLGVTIIILFSFPFAASPDTIYGNKGGGRDQVLAERVLVISENPSIVWLYHHRDGIVLENYCPTIPGESCRATRFSPEEREALIEEWKETGYTVEVTHSSGLKTTVHNFYLTVGAPEGFDGVAAPVGALERTYVELMVGGSRERIGFHRLSRIENSGDSMTAFLLDGQRVTGQLQVEFSDSGEALPPFLGGIESYNIREGRYYRNLSEVRSVEFVSP